MEYGLSLLLRPWPLPVPALTVVVRWQSGPIVLCSAHSPSLQSCNRARPHPRSSFSQRFSPFRLQLTLTEVLRFGIVRSVAMTAGGNARTMFTSEPMASSPEPMILVMSCFNMCWPTGGIWGSQATGLLLAVQRTLMCMEVCRQNRFVQCFSEK